MVVIQLLRQEGKRWIHRIVSDLTFVLPVRKKPVLLQVDK